MNLLFEDHVKLKSYFVDLEMDSEKQLFDKPRAMFPGLAFSIDRDAGLSVCNVDTEITEDPEIYSG